jgi:PAS domain S-box-containing protein
MTESLKILLLEDNPEDAEIVQRQLKRANFKCVVKVATNKETFLQALDDFNPAIILSDNHLPQFSAEEALIIVQQRSLLIPFILVTGTATDEFAANIIKSGADDYILKDRLTRLPLAIDAALKQRQVEKERQKTIEKLAQSEKKYRTLFSKSPLPKWIYDFETLRFLEVNEAAIRHYGYTSEEFLSMTIKDIRPVEDQEHLTDDLNKVENDPDIRTGNWRHRKKNGELIIVDTTAHFIDYANRKARMVVARDITDQVKMEQQKEFDRNNLSALINNTDDLIWSIDNNFNLVTCNESFRRMIVMVSGQPIASGDYILSSQFTKEQVARYLSFYNRAFSGETFSIIEQFDSPIQFWSEISFYPIRQDGVVAGTACFSRDITKRKKNEEELHLMEERLLNQKVQEQKEVTRAIIKAQERERDYIGRELHDNVSQILASTKLYLAMAGKKKEELKEIIKYPLELIDSSILEIRVLTSGYVAPRKDVNLEELIQTLLDKVKDTSAMQTMFTYDTRDDVLNEELKLNLYRILQEQINNIIKHADAKNINVTLMADGNVIQLIIADDGKGFDPDAKRKGIGISNMINRIESFNGEMRIESSPGNGCRTYIRIPDQ